MQYKETSGYFCKPDKLSTFRIGKGENSLIRVYYPSVKRGQNDNNNVVTTSNNEEKQDYHVEIDDDDDDGEEEEEEAIFPEKLKYIYAITRLPFSQIKQQINHKKYERRPNGHCNQYAFSK